MNATLFAKDLLLLLMLIPNPSSACEIKTKPESDDGDNGGDACSGWQPTKAAAVEPLPPRIKSSRSLIQSCPSLLLSSQSVWIYKVSDFNAVQEVKAEIFIIIIVYTVHVIVGVSYRVKCHAVMCQGVAYQDLTM